ncbi:MAG: ATP-binding protein [bacterium]
MNRYLKLIEDYVKSPKENECIEFKENNCNPHLIGEYLSALSNSATLHGKNRALLIFGIEDETGKIVGTNFYPSKTKGKGNEDLEPWLSRKLSPRIDFKIIEFDHDGKHIVIFEIDATLNTPVKFDGEAFIRVGGYKHRLTEHSEKERKIWKKAESASFEKDIAASNLSLENVLNKIDYHSFFKLLKIPVPENKSRIIEELVQDGIVIQESDNYSITNLGALLLAKNLHEFDHLSRKAMRVIIYNGNNRVNAKKEITGKKGYAAGFKGLIDWIDDQIPSNELIEEALRVEKKMYPKLAIREFIANALIHQDFTETGRSPMVEIFDTRIEITNPGCPLIDTDRFIDYPPKTRNEKLASLMRRMSICEERGSGVDRALTQVEIFQLPPPLFQAEKDYTKVTLYSYREYRDMDRIEKIRACYQHACLKWVCGEYMTNSSIRERMKIDLKNSAIISRIIKEALVENVIKIHDDSVGTRARKYLPWWA